MATLVRRCPHCQAIRYAMIVDVGDMVPYGAEIITTEQARAQHWAHLPDCPERKPTQLSIPAPVASASAPTTGSRR